jgi:hypothetical protein
VKTRTPSPSLIATVQRVFLKRSSERTDIYIDAENYWAVQESVEDVVAKIEQAMKG